MLGEQFIEQMRLPPLFRPLGLELAGPGNGAGAGAGAGAAEEEQPAGSRARRKGKPTDEHNDDEEGEGLLSAAQLRARRRRELEAVSEETTALGALENAAQLEKGDSTAQEVRVHLNSFAVVSCLLYSTYYEYVRVVPVALFQFIEIGFHGIYLCRSKICTSVWSVSTSGTAGSR